jgi:CheY-like chemotaxis protein
MTVRPSEPPCVISCRSNQGFRFAAKLDEFDALEKVRTLRPDLIVMDLSMPRMDGLQTARVLRAKAVPVPIILFTIYAEELRPQDATEAGISAVVAKADLSVLNHQIEKLLVAES